MQVKSLPPMSGGSGDQKHDVICIEAKRICDFCFQEHRLDRTFRRGADSGSLVECEIDTTNVVCREVSRKPIDDKDKFLVCIAIEVPVTIRIFNEQGQIVDTIRERVVFLKQAVLCVPAGTMIDCQVSGECCCFLDTASGEISCTFAFCVVLQVSIMVKVLVQTLGTCMPKECKTFVACPQAVPKDCGKCDC